MASHIPRIAIVGAGPAGLTLGVLLHKHNIPFTVFELRAQPTDTELDEPSGLLDLHEDTGLAAIRACDLMDEFTPLTSICSQAMAIADGKGNILHRTDGGPENRPEIARNDLTRLLLRKLPADCVRWGRKLVSVARDDAITTLDFGPHGTEDFDLVVGADGAWSRVRPLLTDVQPAYANVQYVMATLRNVSKKHPALADFIGTGSLFCMGAGNCALAYRAAQDSTILYLCVRSEDADLLAGTAEMSPSQAKGLLLGNGKLFGSFTGTARELIATACDEESRDHPDQNAHFRRLYALPAGHRWTHKAGVTLIGDAAHVTTPFAGEGVNLAMSDSLDLAGIIRVAWEKDPVEVSAFRDVLDEPLAAFEEKMAQRAEPAAQEAIGNTQLMFAEDGAQVMVGLFQGASGES